MQTILDFILNIMAMAVGAAVGTVIITLLFAVGASALSSLVWLLG